MDRISATSGVPEPGRPRPASGDGDPRPTLIQHAVGTRFDAVRISSGDLVFEWNWSYLISIRGLSQTTGADPIRSTPTHGNRHNARAQRAKRAGHRFRHQHPLPAAGRARPRHDRSTGASRLTRVGAAVVARVFVLTGSRDGGAACAARAPACRATSVALCWPTRTSISLPPETPSSRPAPALDRYQAASPTARRVSVRLATHVRISISARGPRTRR